MAGVGLAVGVGGIGEGVGLGVGSGNASCNVVHVDNASACAAEENSAAAETMREARNLLAAGTTNPHSLLCETFERWRERRH